MAERPRGRNYGVKSGGPNVLLSGCCLDLGIGIDGDVFLLSFLPSSSVPPLSFLLSPLLTPFFPFP